jgi:hypothetical protein
LVSRAGLADGDAPPLTFRLMTWQQTKTEKTSQNWLDLKYDLPPSMCWRVGPPWERHF